MGTRLTRLLRPAHRPRLWATLLVAAAAACTDAPTRPGGIGYVLVQPVLDQQVDLAATYFVVDVVHVVLSRGTQVVLDRTVTMSPDEDQVSLDLEVPLQAAVETLDLLVELRGGAEILFRGTQSVVVRQGTSGGQEPIEIALQYVGPGANIAGLAISPRRPYVLFGAEQQFTVTAVDSQQAPVTDFYVGWVTSDASLATINADGLLRAAATLEGSLWVHARTPTGIADSVSVTVTAGGQGRIIGTLRDAATGGLVVGGTVDVRAGPNATIEDPVTRSTTSDANGGFTLDALDAGEYTLFAEHPAYLRSRVPGISLAPSEDLVLSVSLSPPLAAGQTRIILSWGAEPRDVDAHLEVPDTAGGAPFVVYYGNPGDPQVYPFAQLDVDVTSGFGPETMTIYQQLSGTYVYHVHDFTTYQDAASTLLAGSGARVEVYQNNQLVQIFTVPNQPGTLWTVFQLDGTTITPVNRMSGDLPPGGGALVNAGTGQSRPVRAAKADASR